MLKFSTSLMAVSALALALGGCASTGPAAPTVGVMPAKGKSYEAFQRDDDYCQAAAQRQVGYRSPGETANTSAVQSAAVGTALGALDALTRIELQRLIEEIWRAEGFTALLVTHDVSEALMLADRVLLIEDGAIGLDLTIDLPRPRRRDIAELAQLEEQILERLLTQKNAA